MQMAVRVRLKFVVVHLPSTSSSSPSSSSPPYSVFPPLSPPSPLLLIISVSSLSLSLIMRMRYGDGHSVKGALHCIIRRTAMVTDEQLWWVFKSISISVTFCPWRFRALKEFRGLMALPELVTHIWFLKHKHFDRSNVDFVVYFDVLMPSRPLTSYIRYSLNSV